MKKNIVIGQFGFGVVGEGLYYILGKNKVANTKVEKICVKDPDKERSISPDMITYNKDEIIHNKDINLVVELINDHEAAYDIVKSALKNGKSVVSGNKKMISENLEEFIKIQENNGVALLYDASACGSIPIIRNLEEYYDNDLLMSITGILNGSSNYILSKIFTEDHSYDAALKEAQDKGFAESNPEFDVEGYDSLYKLVIIATHSLGTWVNPTDIFVTGISKISPEDIAYAKEKGLKIKLVAYVTKLPNNKFTMFVMPKLVEPAEYIYNVESEFNGVIIKGQYYDKQFMFGKGAGAYPTSSAVLSDITARNYNYKYEYKKRKYFQRPEYSLDTSIKIYLSYNNMLDFSHFEFLKIDEKYISKNFNYVTGWIKLSDLKAINHLIRKMDIFLAFMED